MPDWTLECHTVGPLQMNAWLLLDHASGDAALIDPGDEVPRLLDRIDNSGCQLRWLLATHGHFDHVAGAAEVQQQHDLPLRLHPADEFLVENMPQHQALYGLPKTAVPRMDPSLCDGDVITLGACSLNVLHVPGHSPGQVMYVWDGHAIVGDCLFAGSIGRTDLPGGSFAVLEASIREKIYVLPGDTQIHPGHGPDTTVDRERRTNPFVSGE